MHCITLENKCLSHVNAKGVGITVYDIRSSMYCSTFVTQVYKGFFAVQVHSTAETIGYSSAVCFV